MKREWTCILSKYLRKPRMTVITFERTRGLGTVRMVLKGNRAKPFVVGKRYALGYEG